MKCPKCQKQYDQEKQFFCSDCGVSLVEDETTVPQETTVTEEPPKKKKRSPIIIILIVLALLILVPLALLLVLALVIVFVALILMVVALFLDVNFFNVPLKEATMQPPVAVVTTIPDAIPTLPAVSDEPTEALAVVPSCVGMSEEDAMVLLQEEGFAVSVIYEYNDYFAEGTVDSVIPEAGFILSKGDEVTLYVSKGSMECPYPYSQLVKVTASEGSSYGQLQAYEWVGGDWELQFSCDASVGRNGIGADYGEGKGISPEGTFPIGVAFAAGGVETYDWPVERVTLDTCIVDDVNSPYYNTVQSISELPDGVSYDTIGNTVINGFSGVCIFIEHNGDGYSSEGVVPGKGSVITICSKYDALEPTAGCVDISTADMTTLLQWLDTSKNPYIAFAAE